MDKLAVAVRAWASSFTAPRNPLEDPGPSAWSLVFDTETLTDLSQRLRIGTYQMRRGAELREEGLFVDIPALSPGELQLARDYAARHDLRLRTREEFVEQVFFRVAETRRGRVIGFNLPFDISRIAIGHGPARARSRGMRGGFSFRLAASPYRPAIQIKRIGARAAFIRLTVPKHSQPEQRGRARGGRQANHQGYFIDVATAAAALVGHTGTLPNLAELLEVPTPKAAVEVHGQELTEAYLDYARTDVQTTWECYEALETRFHALGLTETRLDRIYSEASIGKAYLAQMSLRPWRACQPDFPDWVLATIMETYYGGRAESHVRHTAVPGVLVDFTSQYPTAFCLQGLDRYLLADGVDWQWEDPGRVNELLGALEPEHLLDTSHGIWRQLDCLVEIAPDGDRLPTRAHYNPCGPAMNVAIAQRSGGPVQWFTLADAIASKLETGRVPKILRVMRFAPRARQTLNPIAIAGDRQYLVDPNLQCPIRALVEQRAQLKADRDRARSRGDDQAALRLDAVQRTAKVIANAIAYGVPIEMNVVEHRRPVEVRVHRPDGSSYLSKVTRTEEPGRWFAPLIATWVAGAGRLLLALGMRMVPEAGGEWALCDTDSLFVVATTDGSAHTSISAVSRQNLVALVERLSALSPYDQSALPGSILKIETPLGDEAVWALSIAAKRYALFGLARDERPRIIQLDGANKRSRHGLGHLAPPVPPARDADDWIDELWEYLVACRLGLDPAEPEWFALAACRRLTVTSPNEERAFRSYNAARPYEARVRPFGFVSTCRPHRLERATSQVRTLVAPFETDPATRMGMDWRDRHDPSGCSFRVRLGSLHEAVAVEICVENVRQIGSRTTRPCPSAGTRPAGDRPCWRRSRE